MTDWLRRIMRVEISLAIQLVVCGLMVYVGVLLWVMR
jgi:hypothetical protein